MTTIADMVLRERGKWMLESHSVVDSLRELFKQVDSDHEVIKIAEECQDSLFRYYVLREKQRSESKNFAYDCNDCNKIIIGAPCIYFSNGHELCFSCSECNKQLYSKKVL